MKQIPIRQIAAPHPEAADTGRLRIRTVEALLDGADMVQELHRHDFYLILALEKGAGIHEIDFTPYDIRDHTVFVLRPGQVHQLRLAAGSTGFLMEFDTRFYQPKDPVSGRRFRKAVHKNHCSGTPESFGRIRPVLATIFEEFSVRAEGYTEVVRASLDILFIGLIRQSALPQATGGNAAPYVQERFEELQALLESRITELKQVAQYAGLMHLSPYQLNAITKACVGKTASDLINAQLVLEAKRQLLATPQQIKDIAWQLGYEDTSYFIRFFRKHTGYSPEAYRHNFR